MEIKKVEPEDCGEAAEIAQQGLDEYWANQGE